MTSIIKVDEIQTTSGSGFVKPMAGSIIQMQYTQYTGTNTYSITANTDTVLTDLTVNITPTSTSSKIMITAGVFHEQAYDVWDSLFFFYRDSTKLSHATSGSRKVGIAVANNPYYGADNVSTPNWVQYSYFDTPSSTSQITYKVGFIASSAQTFALNRCLGDSDNVAHERGISHISVTEIAA